MKSVTLLLSTNLETGVLFLKNQGKMMKLISCFNRSLLFRQLRVSENRLIARSMHDCNPNNEDEEIVHTVLENSVAIGMNLPETKNVLTERALQKLHESIKNFERDDKLYSAVLFGYGGNFCTGIVATNEAVKLSHNLLKTLNTLKKPIIGALDGRTRGFGLHLAIMCDMRLVEEPALIGLNKSNENLELLPFVYERLILTVGLGNASELILTQNMWSANECLSTGLANKIVKTGSSMGQAVLWAKSCAFSHPLEKVFEEKSKILSILHTKKVN